MQDRALGAVLSTCQMGIPLRRSQVNSLGQPRASWHVAICLRQAVSPDRDDPADRLAMIPSIRLVGYSQLRPWFNTPDAFGVLANMLGFVPEELYAVVGRRPARPLLPFCRSAEVSVRATDGRGDGVLFAELFPAFVGLVEGKLD